MSSIILYHHLGLGDHIMCHGIVREYCKKYEKVVIFSWPHNYPSVSFMFRDLTNLTIIKGGDDDAMEYIQKNASLPENLKYDEVKIIGFKNLNSTNGMTLEEQFYKFAGIPLYKKWDSFFIKRDFEKEEETFKKAAPVGDYAFIHEDIPRGYGIKKELIDKNCTLLTVERSISENIIDYCTIIEKAKEIHVIDSSLMFLIDCLPYKNPNQKLVIHRYARPNDEWLLPVLKKDWNIIVKRYDNLEPSQGGYLKDLLTEISGVENTIRKRFIRKIFKKMSWGPLMPRHPDLAALIRRYVYRKTFLIISPASKSRTYLSSAQTIGALSVNLQTLEQAEKADVVFCSEAFSNAKDQSVFLSNLHLLTKEYLILFTKNIPADQIKLLLTQAGFETREKHLFPSEICFVCRAIPKKNI